MDRSIIAGIVALACVSAHAGPYFVYTNEQGRLQFSQDHGDTAYAVGSVTTSAVMPYVEQPAPLPAQFDNGIALKDEAGHWWKPVVLGGELEHIQISNSPLDPEQAKAMEDAGKAEIKAARSNRLTRIERISIDLQQVNAQIEGTNWVDVVLTGISTTAGTWSDANQRATITAIKTALQATKNREQNLKVAVRNLMQATEKVRKEIEP